MRLTRTESGHCTLQCVAQASAAIVRRRLHVLWSVTDVQSLCLCAFLRLIVTVNTQVCGPFCLPQQ